MKIEPASSLSTKNKTSWNLHFPHVPITKALWLSTVNESWWAMIRFLQGETCEGANASPSGTFPLSHKSWFMPQGLGEDSQPQAVTSGQEWVTPFGKPDRTTTQWAPRQGTLSQPRTSLRVRQRARNRQLDLSFLLCGSRDSLPNCSRTNLS